MSNSIISTDIKFSLKEYDSIILDCDGVVLDSNFIKENNIKIALSNYLFGEDLIKCMKYFNDNAGIAREAKLQQFISDKTILNNILKEYNSLNLESLKKAPLVTGILNFIKSVHANGIPIDLLSGGDQDEVIEIFKYRGIYEVFNNIYGGPKSKMEHLKNKKLSSRPFFFGDSAYDFQIAKVFNIDFGFIYGQTDQILINNCELIKIVAPNFENIKIL